VLFVHIPKTGGYSIRTTFLERPSYRLGIDPSWEYDFSFAFVRNPFERFYSTYNMFKYGTVNKWGRSMGLPRKKDLTIERSIEILQDENIGHTNNRKEIDVFIKHHALPMTHPFNCLGYGEKIYRFENFTQSIAEIQKKLNIRKPLPHLNKSLKSGDSYREALSRRHRTMLEEIYKEDLESFNYNF
jgi:hypothetical protein